MSGSSLRRDAWWFGFFLVPTVLVYLAGYLHASAVLIIIFVVLCVPTTHFLLNLLDRWNRDPSTNGH